MSSKEAKARIKINKLLEHAHWRFLDDEHGTANIVVEHNAKLKQNDIDAFGENFEKSKNGFIDFLLLDERGFPLVVLEAKKEEKDPLDGKEQARRYAISQNVRFIILSNGNIHYFWDIAYGNPSIITDFPTLESLKHKTSFTPNVKRISDEIIDKYYIANTQKPHFQDDPAFQNTLTCKAFLEENGLRIMRPYQVGAVEALQRFAKEGNERFLFEMATGTGKTLTSAAVIKLFLRTGNAKRVLFLVDRLELENQAEKSFVRLLKNDYTTVIYKQNKEDWKKAEIVVTTVQSLMSNDKYKKLFSPTDFDLIIADESHRAINGNSRAVFEYFVGFKLGLTATPKDYLKNATKEDDQRSWERRILLDTYKTFGCESGEPTFRYSLLDGVKEGFLINPIVVDARTDVTAELLSQKGFSVHQLNAEGEEEADIFTGKDFERSFFSEATNIAFCEAFMKSALKDPLSGEIGKTIIFCVSQKHATKITQILNEIAFKLYPDKYHSDFAMQVTSNVSEAQTMTTNFANNNLNGNTHFLEGYKSSKTRVCITVGMMTTGYDCEDLLNICLMRPVFSPSDFVQIKGRGTRKFTFNYKDAKGILHTQTKERFKFFDFFANCEYFEEQFNYDEVLKIPRVSNGGTGTETPQPIDSITITSPDALHILTETPVGFDGMRIDRELFSLASQTITADEEIKTAVFNDQWDKAVEFIRERYEDKPNLYLNLDRIRKSENLDRRVSWREVLERMFGFIDRFDTKDEKLESEVEKFISIEKPEAKYVPHIRNFIKAYIGDEHFRAIINAKEYAELNTYPAFGMAEFRALNGYRESIPNYIKNYIPLNQYMN
ncbi:MAG: DEAD/DEAH box helicase family protein [Campylobacteraceae bacterium]|nr:DEAD/DEAH box helicase family protein [Campylobacteraceae bacterium]